MSTLPFFLCLVDSVLLFVKEDNKLNTTRGFSCQRYFVDNGIRGGGGEVHYLSFGLCFNDVSVFVPQ